MDLATQTHLKTLRDLLAYRREALQAEVRADASACREDVAVALGTDVADRKDEAEARERAAVDDAQLERDLAELREVTSALARLDAGTYGDCEACGEPIPLKRLLARPEAARCAACQAARER